MAKKHQTYYGLPSDVVFCKKCVMSNQRPSSYPEFRHTSERKTPTLHIDKNRICDACRFAEKKEQIDWEAREDRLVQLLNVYRRSDGQYDCVVPGSGGKDSAWAAHLLKEKYGMHPLTVTWHPTLYTDYGLLNHRNWIEIGGFDNVMFKPNGQAHKLLTRLGIENLFHPFQTFILGQKNLAPKVAMQYGIPLVFYGENEAEYGNPLADNETSLRSKAFHTMEDLSDVYLGGVSVPKLIEVYDLELSDLMPYFPANVDELARSKIDVHYLGYYVKWTPQEAYYYASEHCGFEARPFRTEGTYGKYSGIDDKIEDLHYYTSFLKFGLGRASHDASQEIRNRHLTREEGVALVRRFDGEFPARYFQDVMDYLEMAPQQFIELQDKSRSPHLWQWTDGEWQLRHQAS